AHRVRCATASWLAERGDPVDATDEQHALFIDFRVAKTVPPRLTSIFGPDLVELPGHILAAGLPFPHLLVDRAFDLHPVVRILRIDQQDREARLVADPLALAAVRGGRRGEAQKAMARGVKLDPGFRASKLANYATLRRPEDVARYAHGLRMAGLLD